jgi:uncharacterized integral membrane protein
VSPRDFASFAAQTPEGSGPEDPAPDPTPPAPEPAQTGKVDPLRGSRTSGFWVAVLVLVLVLLLLAVFILQNTQKVEISFFGWDGHAPLAASLLIAAVAGALVVASAGLLRILQLRRRVKRERKA